MKITWKWMKSALGYLFLGFVAFVVIFSMVRLSDTKIAKEYLWTDAAKQVYGQSPEDYHVYEVPLTNYFDPDGYFFALNLRYSMGGQAHDFGQFQLTVRYNDVVTNEYLGQDFDLSAGLPEEPFVYRLADNLGNVYEPAAVLPDEKMNLNYRRLAFEGFNLSEVGQVDLEIYYAGDCGEDTLPYRTITIYKSAWPVKNYALKKSELPDMGG